MTDAEKANEWCRYLKATVSQETRLATLAHLPDAMRLAVLKKLGAISAADVFEVTK